MSLPRFQHQDQSFYFELRKRINRYFEEKGIGMTGNFSLYFKAFILTLILAGLYVHICFFTPHWTLLVLESGLMGLAIAGIGFNVMHDGGHGSFSTRPWVNKLSAYSVNVLGGNSFMWDVKHNVIHHTYTNVEGVDDDIDIEPWMRMTENQRKFKMHRYQHIYFWALYSFLYLLWIFVLDYQKYFKQRIGQMKITTMKISDHVAFWLFKVLHIFIFIVVPIYFMGWKLWLVSFLVMTLVAGFVLSIVFQLAHTVEHTSFPSPNPTSGKMEDEWAIHQLKTTANFATQNKIVSWFVGGLNFQIEHHLFPKISHVHYPAISKIIKQTCSDFGVNYVEYPRVSYAVASHVSFLKHMGRL